MSVQGSMRLRVNCTDEVAPPTLTVIAKTYGPGGTARMSFD